MQLSIDTSAIETLIKATAKEAAEEAALNAVATLAPQRQIIEIRRLDQGDMPVKTIEGAHANMARLLRLMSAGVHVYLWGPPGSGKSTAVLQAAAALGREAHADTMDPGTFPSRIQGFIDAHGNRQETAFSRAWYGGHVFDLDEADSMPGPLQNTLGMALANDLGVFAWGQAPRAPGFVLCASGNTAGRPTAQFPERKPMSAAFKDRLYFIHWDLDENLERDLVGLPRVATPTEEHTTCTPQQWVEWTFAMRAWAKGNAPTLMVSPRVSRVGVQVLALGESVAHAADGLVFKGCDGDLRDKALRNVPLPVEVAGERVAVPAQLAGPGAEEPDEDGEEGPDEDGVVRGRPTSGVYHAISGTQFTDHVTRAMLRAHGARWIKRRKIFVIPVSRPLSQELTLRLQAVGASYSEVTL